MVVADRIKELAADKNMTMKEFSSLIGVSERTIQNYLGGISLPNGRFLTDLSEKIGASPTWILVGSGPKYIGDNHQNLPSGITQKADRDFVTINRYEIAASAGHGALVGHEQTGEAIALRRNWLAARGLSPDRLAVISVRGDSMAPVLTDGELIMLDGAQTTPRDGAIFVVSYSDGLFVKRIQQLPGDRLQLISTNPDYPPIIVDQSAADQVKVIGRVVASMREW